MKRWRFQGEMSKSPDGHPIDRLVAKRIRPRRRQRHLADLSQLIVDALGDQSQLWFDYETTSTDLGLALEAAYFDAGVSHGLAAASVESASETSVAVREQAARVVRELLAAGLAPSDAAAAASLAAWSLVNFARRSTGR